MATTKRSKEQREKDLAELSVLVLEGWTHAELAVKFQVSRPQIAYDIRILDKRWAAEQLANTHTRKLRRHAELERVKRLALEAFAKSRQDGETLHVSKESGRATATGTPLPDKEVSWRTVKGQAGDAALLEKYLKAVAEQIDLWGDGAAQQHEHSGSIAVELSVDARRARLLSLVDSLRQRGGTDGVREAVVSNGSHSSNGTT